MIITVNSISYNCLPLLIDGEESRFMVSDCGNVFTFFRGQWRKKSSHIDEYGYERMKINWRGIRKYKRVHRMVALVFLSNPDNLPEVNHKDLVKTNNRLDNLEWSTKSNNSKHAYDNNAIKFQGGYKVDQAKKVGKFRNGEMLAFFKSLWQLRKHGYPLVSISRAATSGKKYRGFHWKFL